MAKVNFTAKRVQEHTCPEGRAQAFLWDAHSPGLGLRATANGAKSYIFQGRVNGQTLRLTIGDPRSWSIDKAQDEARRLQTLIDAGKDPREHAAEQRAAHEARKAEARRKGVTVGEAWADYIAARRPRWTERHHKDHLDMSQPGGEAKRRGTGKTTAGPLAPLMALRLSDLSADRVSAWLDEVAQTRPASAALAFRLLRAFIRWCDDRPEYSSLVPAGAYSAQSVRDAQPKVKPKDDVLQREQLPAWFAAVRSLGNPVVSAYLQGLLLTGARREELAGLRWDDVDFQWGSLTIRDKVEGERTIPLTPYLASLLAALPRRNEWALC